jgi:hypothetical protein
MRTTQPVLHIGARDLVVVAGLPGAGKSTLLHRVRIHGRARVLDPEQVADAVARAVGPLPWDVPYRAYRPLVHIVHWARFVAWGLAGSGAADRSQSRCRTAAMRRGYAGRAAAVAGCAWCRDVS